MISDHGECSNNNNNNNKIHFTSNATTSTTYHIQKWFSSSQPTTKPLTSQPAAGAQCKLAKKEARVSVNKTKAGWIGN